MSPSPRLWLAIGLAFVPAGMLAQRAASQGANKASATKSAGGAAPGTADGYVNIKNSTQGTAVWDDGQGLARLTKDVVIWQTGEDFILYAQDVTYSRPRNQAVALGKLRVETRDSTLKGNRLTGDFNDKKLSMLGNVTITSHGKKDGIVTKDNPNRPGFRDELDHKPMRITCDRVDWDYETRQARITGNIRIYQGSNSGTCDLIIYDEPRNLAQLQGNVRFGDDKKRVFLGNDILIFIDSGHVQSDKGTRVLIPRDTTSEGTPAAPRPTRAPLAFSAPRSIDPSVFADTGLTPPTPAPTPNAKPTELGDEPPPAPADEEPPAPTK